MVVFLNKDGSRPTPKDVGLKDFYHDEQGKYDTPVFVPFEYKDRLQEYFDELKKKREGKESCIVKEDNSYKLENESRCDNLTWGREHYINRCYGNREYQSWLDNWN